MNRKRTLSLLCVLVWLFIAALACGNGEGGAAPSVPTEKIEPPETVATDTPTPASPTELPTLVLLTPSEAPSPTPTTELVAGEVGLEDLKEEIFVGPGGGNGVFCISPPAEVELHYLSIVLAE